MAGAQFSIGEPQLIEYFKMVLFEVQIVPLRTVFINLVTFFVYMTVKTVLNIIGFKFQGRYINVVPEDVLICNKK